MIKKIGLILLVLLVQIYQVKGQAGSRNDASIDLEGTILSDNRTLQGALVNVTRDGKPFTSFLTDIDGSYNLYLPMGSEYVVTVSKKDYVKKMYTVSTTGVSKESEQKKFPVIVADVELFLFYDGVDYSIFNQPMNKYYYNPKKDNFEYDKKYLKYMLAKVEEIKREQLKAQQLAKNKTKEQAEYDKIAAENARKAEEDAKKAEDIAKTEAMKKERAAMEDEMMKKMQEEQAAKKQEMDKRLAEQAAQLNDFMKEKPVAKDNTEVKNGMSLGVSELLAHYKKGVTEEIIQGKNVVIIQRVVVRDDMAWVYQKKIFTWGGVACFRDGVSISESTFDHETKPI